jgi:hypothetical protein
MNGVGFNKVNKILKDVSGLDAYVCDLTPIESHKAEYGHKGGVNFSVLLPNDAFTKFTIRYFNDDMYSVEVSKYNKFDLKYESALVDKNSLTVLFKAIYEEINILNNILLDDLDFTLSTTAQKDLIKLKELDNNY